MKKILIVKIGAIGDVVMALPLLSALHAQKNLAHITWICGKAAAPILQATRLIDQLIVIDETKLLAGSLFQKCKALFGLWKKIAFVRFDQFFLLHSDPRYRLIPLFTRCKDRQRWGEKNNRYTPLPGRHHSNEALSLLTKEHGPYSYQLSFPPLSLPSNPYPAFFEDLPVIALAPGGAKNVLADDALRRWPLSHYVELAEQLLLHPCRIALIGSDTDRWVENAFSHLPVHSFIGRFHLLESVSFLKHVSLFITHDSGPLHLAKLVQCPTIALFGPTTPHERVSPQENIHVLWGGEHLSCRPCYAKKSYASCSSNRCLIDLLPSQVLDKAIKLLERSHGRAQSEPTSSSSTH